MERTAWTDERLDDLAERMDSGFDRVDADIRELKGEVGSLRVEMRSEFRAVRSDLGDEINSLRTTAMLIGGGIMAAMVGLIATLLAGS